MNNTLTFAALAAALAVPALAQQALSTPEDIANEQITVIALMVQALGSEEEDAVAKTGKVQELTERIQAVNAAKKTVDKAALEAVETQMIADPNVQQVIALFAAIIQQQAAENFGGSLDLQQAVLHFLQACSESGMGGEAAAS